MSGEGVVESMLKPQDKTSQESFVFSDSYEHLGSGMHFVVDNSSDGVHLDAPTKGIEGSVDVERHPSPSRVRLTFLPKANVVVGPIKVINADFPDHVIQEIIQIHLTLQFLFEFRIRSILQGNPTNERQRSGMVSGKCIEITGDHIHLIIRNPGFCRKKMFVGALTQIVHPIIFPIQKNMHRSIRLGVQSNVTHQGLPKRVAQHGKCPVIATIAQEQLFDGYLFVGVKKAAIKPVVSVTRSGNQHDGFLI